MESHDRHRTSTTYLTSQVTLHLNHSKQYTLTRSPYHFLSKSKDQTFLFISPSPSLRVGKSRKGRAVQSKNKLTQTDVVRLYFNILMLYFRVQPRTNITSQGQILNPHLLGETGEGKYRRVESHHRVVCFENGR